MVRGAMKKGRSAPLFFPSYMCTEIYLIYTTPSLVIPFSNNYGNKFAHFITNIQSTKLLPKPILHS